jgi:hypothetical protein
LSCRWANTLNAAVVVSGVSPPKRAAHRPERQENPKPQSRSTKRYGLLRIGPDASAGMVRMLTTFGPVST